MFCSIASLVPRSVFRQGAVLSLTSLLVCCSFAAHAQELLTNGNFETGSLSGWTVTTHGNGSFFAIAPGTDTPAVSPDTTTFHTAANSAGGTAFAVSASGNPGVQALLQNFVVPTNSTGLTLSFQMFVNDQSFFGPAIDPTGLDETTGGLTIPNDNQHARVDLLQAGAADLSTNASDVLHNFTIGVDNPGGLTPNPYISYTFDIAPFVTPGGTYRLRFADVNNLGSINVGVDNVSVFNTSVSSVPEPGALLAFTSCLLASGATHALRRRALRPDYR